VTIRVSYENAETGQTETAELPSGNWIVLCAKASDVVQAMFRGIASHNGMMREFRAQELAQQAFDGLMESDTLVLEPLTDEQREDAHMAILRATLTLRDYMTHALHGLPEDRQEDARRLAQDLGLLDAPDPQPVVYELTREQCEQSGGHQYKPKEHGYGPNPGPCVRCGWFTSTASSWD